MSNIRVIGKYVPTVINSKTKPCEDNKLKSLELIIHAREGYSTFYYNNEVYLVGGLLQGGIKAITDVIAYNLSSKTWTVKQPLNWSRCYGAGILHNNMFYVFGGKTGSGSAPAIRSTVCYDPHANIWIDKKPGLLKRHSHQAIIVANKIIILGGQCEIDDRVTITDAAEMYDPITDEWRLAPEWQLPTPMCVRVACDARTPFSFDINYSITAGSVTLTDGIRNYTRSVTIQEGKVELHHEHRKQVCSQLQHPTAFASELVREARCLASKETLLGSWVILTTHDVQSK